MTAPNARGVLAVEPAAPTQDALSAGEHWPLGRGDDAPLLFVPTALPAGPLPLIVLLHGAGSRPEQALPILRDAAERAKVLVLVPKSHDHTWDVIRGGFGRDVVALDAALAAVFDRFPVDAARIAIAGFSDGASYALTLGLINGELFSRILAFSPGFVLPGRRRGRPTVFISHGRADGVLPIDRCSRIIVEGLQRGGFAVDYREFDGGHEVPADLGAAAVELLR